MYLYICLSLFWGDEGKVQSFTSKMAANLSLLLKVVAGQHTGSKHLTSLSGML